MHPVNTQSKRFFFCKCSARDRSLSHHQQLYICTYIGATNNALSHRPADCDNVPRQSSHDFYQENGELPGLSTKSPFITRGSHPAILPSLLIRRGSPATAPPPTPPEPPAEHRHISEHRCLSRTSTEEGDPAFHRAWLATLVGLPALDQRWPRLGGGGCRDAVRGWTGTLLGD